MSLKLDWGRDGLHFHDSPEDGQKDAFGSCDQDPCPNGDVLERKWCARLTPSEVRGPESDLKVHVATTTGCQVSRV